MFIEAPLSAERCPAPPVFTRPHACELLCIFVLHRSYPDWMAAGFETLPGFRVEKDSSMSQPEKVSTGTGRREGDAVSCTSVRRVLGQAGSRSGPPRHVGFRVLSRRSRRARLPVDPPILPAVGPDLQPRSLGEVCPNFRPPSPPQTGGEQPISNSLFFFFWR